VERRGVGTFIPSPSPSFPPPPFLLEKKEVDSPHLYFTARNRARSPPMSLPPFFFPSPLSLTFTIDRLRCRSCSLLLLCSDEKEGKVIVSASFPFSPPPPPTENRDASDLLSFPFVFLSVLLRSTLISDLAFHTFFLPDRKILDICAARPPRL